MYESPITRITEDIMKDLVKREEDYLMESVHKVGFDIDKEELAKALRYDKDQYEKGFNDGRLSAEPRWIPVTERKPDDGCRVIVADFGYVEVARWFDGRWYDIDGITLKGVAAWMPLPEPWKGEADAEID